MVLFTHEPELVSQWEKFIYLPSEDDVAPLLVDENVIVNANGEKSGDRIVRPPTAVSGLRIRKGSGTYPGRGVVSSGRGPMNPGLNPSEGPVNYGNVPRVNKF